MSIPSTTEFIRQLTQLEAKLLKEFIKESNPSNWIGDGFTLNEMGEKKKSQRLLDKNNAKGTYAVLRAVKEKRLEMSQPLKKGAAQPVQTQSDLIDELNAQAEMNFKHLQSLN